MRQIKFRAWLKSDEIMVTQSDFHDYAMVCNGDGFGIVHDEYWLKDSDFVIMQSSGPKDKNGKDIFEGDIFICENYSMYGGKYKVVYDDELSAFMLQSLRPLVQPNFLHTAKGIEVIGNIYENPDLITKG